MTTNITIMTLVFAAILTAIGAYRDFKQNHSWGILILWILAFAFFTILSIYQVIVKEESDDNKDRANKNEILDTTIVTSKRTSELVDSTRRSILDSIQIAKDDIKHHSDSNFKKVLNNRPKPDYSPVLEFCYGDPNPFFTLSKNRDTLKCTFGICNSGNDHAYSIIDKIVPINYYGELPKFFQIKSDPLSNKSMTLPHGGKALAFYFNLNVMKNGPEIFPLTHPIYIYIKIDYKNRNEATMRPLKKIFSLKETGFYEVREDIYNKVMGDLKNNNLW